MKKDLISVIVPVYNVEQYLNRCIVSIINQTYDNLEIILIDDGSTDNSGKICDSFSKDDNRIKVFHKKNGGLSDARNFGLEKAIGNYIVFVDSDDSIEEDAISYLYKLITTYNTDISISNINLIYNDKKNTIKNNQKEILLDNNEIIEKMLYGRSYYISSCGKMFKKQLFKNIRFPKGRLYEDVGTIFKLYNLSNNIICGFEYKYNYFIRANSITNKDFSEKEFDLIDMTNEMCDFVSKKYPELKDAINYRKTFAKISLICKKNYVYKKNDKIIKEINKEYKNILKNKKSSKRTKIAVILLHINPRIFFITWKLYCKVTSRKK